MSDAPGARWLLLLHQLPPKPDSFRVKIWRRLQRIGAVALKNSVYALPNNDSAQEHFQWLRREIVEGGGDATVCEARLVDGLSDAEAVALFQAARDADYEAIVSDARQLVKGLPKKRELSASERTELQTALARLKRRHEEVKAIDFFSAAMRQVVDEQLSAIEARLEVPGASASGRRRSVPREGLRGHTWVTRVGIHVDRMACGWLIRRFIDPDARFKFVPPKDYRPQPDELRFDMFDAEFTHEGDQCSFEVLLERAGLDDPALRAIAEIVHDIDLKDSKYEREEVPGIAHLIAGIALVHREDQARLERASAVFGDLYEYFKRKT